MSSKRKTQLALAIAISYACSGGVSQAEDVTGYDVSVSDSRNTAIANQDDIPAATDHRNVVGNKLTVPAVNVATYQSLHYYGGYTLGDGAASGNEIVIGTVTQDYYGQSSDKITFIGGWSASGDAINNIITLSGTAQRGAMNSPSWSGMILIGGDGNDASKDHTTGNTLNIAGNYNIAGGIKNFEKMNFVLSEKVSDGSIMFFTNSSQAFDWTKIGVENAATWKSDEPGAKRVILFQSYYGFTLNNYGVSPVTGTAGDYEYGLGTNTGTSTASTVSATQIYFDRNQIRNAYLKYTTDTTDKNYAGSSIWGGLVYAGHSTIGNDVTNNTLVVEGAVFGNPYGTNTVYGAYAEGPAGDAIGNEVILKGTNTGNNNGDYIYGGVSKNGNATGNTVTLAGNVASRYNDLHLYGGSSPKDATTGNVLQIKGTGNNAGDVHNFEKLRFVLDDSVPNGATMFSLYYGNQTAFDWKGVSVVGLPAWIASLAKANVTNPSLCLLYSNYATSFANYSPILAGTTGDYEIGLQADGYMSGTTRVNVQSITISGNRFQNAGKGENITRGGEVYAGHSTYGNTTNHNELNLAGGSYTYARAGYTETQNGGSQYNTLNLKTGAAITGAGYAGYTTGLHLLANPDDTEHPDAVDTTKNADAAYNTVNVQGGTLGGNAKLYGGYLAKNTALSVASAGEASHNTINIESGTFGGGSEIYGGYTEGTGKATDNVVNLGKTDGTLSAATLGNVTLYGGGGASASDVISGNTLNVYAAASLKDIKNFDTVNFKVAKGSVPASGALLTLTDGGNTSLNWGRLVVDDLDNLVANATSDQILTLISSRNTITFTGYDTTGTRGLIHTTDYEADLVTEGDAASSKGAALVGYHFQNNKNSYDGTGNATEAWGGRSRIGNTVRNNTLTLTGGSAILDARGGLAENTVRDSSGNVKATGDATGNTLTLQTGAQVKNAYGAEARTQAGSATGNTVNLYGGTVAGDVYGGFAACSGKTTGNVINLGDGKTATAVAGTIYGGSGADTTGNILNVSANATAKNIANFSKVNFILNSAQNASNPLLALSDANGTDFDWGSFTVDMSAYTGGIRTLLSNASGLHLTGYTGKLALAADNTSETFVYTDSGTGTNVKSIIIDGSRFQNGKTTVTTGNSTDDIWMGRSTLGNTTSGNTLVIAGGSPRDAYGGWTTGSGTKNAEKSNSKANTLLLQEGSTRNVYGGFTDSAGGNSTGNSVTISGGTVKADSTGVGGKVYGGYVDGAGDATGNGVSITGGSMDSVYAGFVTGSGSATGNRVSIASGNVAGDVYGGYTVGSGKTTGNSIDIGGGQNAAIVGGALIGGSDSDDTGNILQVKGKAQAKILKNFAKVAFHLDSNVQDGDDVLTLSGDTTLRASTIEPQTEATMASFLGSSMEKSVNLIRMKNATLSLTGYTPGSSENRMGSIEYTYRTDNDSAVTTGSL